MRIEIGDYIIVSDSYCCWVEQKMENKKTGTPYTRRISGYCGTFYDLVDSFIGKRILGSKAADLQSALSDIAAAERHAKMIVKELMKQKKGKV